MIDQEKQKLNRKLTLWANAEDFFTDEDGCTHRKVIQFTDSLDACFKWLMPKLEGTIGIEILRLDNKYCCQIKGANIGEVTIKDYEYENLALALCLAIEKLIDGDNK